MGALDAGRGPAVAHVGLPRDLRGPVQGLGIPFGLLGDPIVIGASPRGPVFIAFGARCKRGTHKNQ